jgi:hypothetical protein
MKVPFQGKTFWTKGTMILSVLSSPALVSGMMVARAKNPVHFVLFPIPVFRDTSGPANFRYNLDNGLCLFEQLPTENSFF